MKQYEAIEQLLREARIERSIYLAELITDGIVATWNGVNYAADVLLSFARAKTRNNVVTFVA